jgi:hypothetical protein
LHIIAHPIILTYLFGALAIKNSFSLFYLSILLIAGRTKLNTFVVAAGRTKGFRGPGVAQACAKGTKANANNQELKDIA